MNFFSHLLSQPKRPNLLQPNPTAPQGVRRITNAPNIILIGLGTLVAGAVVTTAFCKADAMHAHPKEKLEVKSQTAETPDWLQSHQAEGVIKPQLAKAQTEPPVDLSKDKEAFDPNINNQTNAGNQPTQMTPYQEARFQQWQQHQQELQQAQMERRQTLKNSLEADTTVYHGNNSNSLAGPGGGGDGLKGTISRDADALAKINATDPAAPEPDNYLLHTRTRSVSPYEVKEGTIIPSVMIGGINSDLPGEIIAQVSHSVYDTATGQYLLIPQGTRIVGAYDHQVVNGQSRVLVIWKRLIYPDATSLTLEGMSGTDAAGYAGFKDKTNTHFWPTFRNALMLSALTAGVQLSQPRSQKGDYSYSSPQIASAALGQEMNQIGMQTVARDLNRRPTLIIRPGYVFNVMVNKDVILPPWNPQGQQAAYGGY